MFKVLTVVLLSVLVVLCKSHGDENNDYETDQNSWTVEKDPDEPDVSVILGYYAPSTSKSKASQNDNVQAKVKFPTSFDDFMPDQSQKKLNRPMQYRMPYKSSTSSPWMKGYTGDEDFSDMWSPSPNDIAWMYNAMKTMKLETEPMGGLLSKFKSEPAVLLIAFVLPLSMILASLLPIILPQFGSLFNKGVNPTAPTITTTASGTGETRGSRLVSVESYLMPAIMDAVESFVDSDDKQPFCIQKVICNLSKNSTELSSVQKNIQQAVSWFGDTWLNELGFNEYLNLTNLDCNNVKC